MHYLNWAQAEFLHIFISQLPGMKSFKKYILAQECPLLNKDNLSVLWPPSPFLHCVPQEFSFAVCTTVNMALQMH